MNKTENTRYQPKEIETWSNRILIHPISDALVGPLAKTGIHPNWISFAGLLSGLGAAWAYLETPAPLYCVAGLALMTIWLICDGIDGKLARLTGRATETGRVIDGIADYITFIAVYLAMVEVAKADGAEWPLALALLAGASHVVQSALYERQRDFYRLDKYPESIDRGKTPGGIYGFFERSNRRIQDLAFDRAPANGKPQPSAKRKVVSEREFNLWNFLSSNSRTGLIFVACLIDAPQLFFIAEIAILNVFLIWLVLRTR